MHWQDKWLMRQTKNWLILPLCSALIIHIWIAGYSPGFPTTKKTWKYQREPRTELQISLRVWTITNKRRDQESLETSTWRKEGSGGILSMSVSTWRAGVKKPEPGFSQWCPVTSGNGDKLKYRKVHQKTRRQFCFVRVVKYWRTSERFWSFHSQKRKRNRWEKNALCR